MSEWVWCNALQKNDFYFYTGWELSDDDEPMTEFQWGSYHPTEDDEFALYAPGQNGAVHYYPRASANAVKQSDI